MPIPPRKSTAGGKSGKVNAAFLYKMTKNNYLHRNVCGTLGKQKKYGTNIRSALPNIYGKHTKKGNGAARSLYPLPHRCGGEALQGFLSEWIGQMKNHPPDPHSSAFFS